MISIIFLPLSHYITLRFFSTVPNILLKQSYFAQTYMYIQTEIVKSLLSSTYNEIRGNDSLKALKTKYLKVHTCTARLGGMIH